MGFLSLRLLLEQQRSAESTAGSQAPHGSKQALADLILMTASGPDLASCTAVGKLGSRLVALVCGLPEGGVKGLVPMCGALGARKLVLRAETDPDMAALCARRQMHRYTMPRCLVECCRALKGMASDELRAMEQAYPELPPLRWEARTLTFTLTLTLTLTLALALTLTLTTLTRWEARLLKEILNSMQQPFVMSLFWSLMKCFTSRRLVDFVQSACEKRRAACPSSLPQPLPEQGCLRPLAEPLTLP